MKRLGLGLLSLLVSFTSLASPAWSPIDQDHLEIVDHFAITIGYSEEFEVPQWVGYVMRKDNLRGCVSRGSNFRVDPLISTRSASPDDYKSSGFDRGHIAPAGDMKWHAQAMSESFYMSNMTPQTAKMNRGQWAQLENQARAWMKEADETLVISGPILQAGLPRIGNSQVAVPYEHYKILLRNRAGKKSAIAFLMGQNPATNDLSTYAVSVRTIEEKTGLNFFPHLSQSEQDDVEQNLDLNQWNFKASFNYDPCLN
ncbi:MAG: DNA/RNA non-specific endonuclease [Bacteriovoracaceae bacterium]|nr:DNA/RNA non-specific endonuclease [Bacteriovoracaceae bacterium]